MSRSWSGRLSGRGQDAALQAAQSAQDGAVAAFLDLDKRQSYVNDAIDAAGQNAPTGHALARGWAPVKQLAFDASARYLATAEEHALHDAADRPTGSDPAAARSAFVDAHRALADAATAVDTFFRTHADELEQARSLRAATPQISAAARDAAVAAEAELTRAEADHVAFRSVQVAAGELVEALSALQTADTVGSPLEIRHAAAAVHAAADTVRARISAARALPTSVPTSSSSVKTRIEAVTTRLAALPETRSALLREFSARCSGDLNGADDRARAAVQRARAEWTAADRARRDGQLEEAADHLATARAQLGAAEADEHAMLERLRVLRQTRADPQGAAKATRFTLRDAQLLVVDRQLVPQWGSVLDAQADRIDRAAAELTGTHPDYWAYLQSLQAVETFVRGVVDRVRRPPR